MQKREWIIDHRKGEATYHKNRRSFVIDLADFDRAKLYNWCITRVDKKGEHFAVRASESYKDGKQYFLFLSRYLMGLSVNDGFMVRHINNDCLDFRRANLNVCARSGKKGRRGRYNQEMSVVILGEPISPTHISNR